jgi:hypothetical protein
MAYSNISILTDQNLSFQVYDFIQLSHDANNYIIGRVVSYNPSTGDLTFTPIKFYGSGSYNTWNISLTGDPGEGVTGSSGTSGTSGTSLRVSNSGPDRILRFGPDGQIIYGATNLTFDGRTLSIDPFEYSTGENPVYRIVYHNDGTAGTAGIVVRGPIVGQPYDGIIENRVPHEYQHQFVVGGNNIAHIDSQGLDVQQALIANGGVYFNGLEEGNSENKFLVWDSSTSGNGLAGEIRWKTISGSPGGSGSSGTSGTSGINGFLKDWETGNEIIVNSNEQLTFSGDYVLENSEMLIESTETEIEYSTNKYFRKEGKIFIGGNLLVKDSYIENNGLISVGGQVILMGNSQIEGTGIII